MMMLYKILMVFGLGLFAMLLDLGCSRLLVFLCSLGPKKMKLEKSMDKLDEFFSLIFKFSWIVFLDWEKACGHFCGNSHGFWMALFVVMILELGCSRLLVLGGALPLVQETWKHDGKVWKKCCKHAHGSSRLLEFPSWFLGKKLGEYHAHLEMLWATAFCLIWPMWRPRLFNYYRSYYSSIQSIDGGGICQSMWFHHPPWNSSGTSGGLISKSQSLNWYPPSYFGVGSVWSKTKYASWTNGFPQKLLTL